MAGAWKKGGLEFAQYDYFLAATLRTVLRGL